MNSFLLFFVLSTEPPKPVPIEMKDLHSIRTGLDVKDHFYCILDEEIDGVVYPGTCEITSLGEF